MSYDINFKFKKEGSDLYLSVLSSRSITWNVTDIIKESTGLKWINADNNGLAIEILPFIEKGIIEIQENLEHYKTMDSSNGWGKAEDVITFFNGILVDWEYLKRTYPDDYKDIYFFID